MTAPFAVHPEAIETLPKPPQDGQMDAGAEGREGGLIRGPAVTRRFACKSARVVRILGLALMAGLLNPGCASFSEVTDLEKIQNTAGFYPKALFYCGSNEICHFFEQETPLADLTPVSKHVRTIMVSRQELKLPDGVEYLRSTYTGKQDERRQMLRIRIVQQNPSRGEAEFPPPNFGQ